MATSKASRALQTRQVVRHISVVSVAKFSALFYGVILIVWLVAGVVLWLLAAGAGVLGALQRLIKSLFGLTSFQFAGPQILLGAILVGLALVLLGTLANVIGVIVYNLIANSVGGVEVTLAERPRHDRPVP